MNENHVYKAIALPAEGQWHIEVPEVERVTCARRYEEIQSVAEELVSIMTGEDAPKVNVTIELPQG